MQFWPTSGTLSETGAGGATAGASGGGGGAAGGGGGALGMMATPSAGEVMLSRAETAALAALEGEEDGDHGLRRAQAESGLSRQQLKMLQRRATTLSSKGYTLKGPNFVKKPLGATPDEPGLTRKAVKGDDTDEPAKPTKPKASKTKETGAILTARVGPASLERIAPTGPELYTCAGVESYGFPQRNSDYDADDPNATESNAESTLSRMLNERSRKRQKRMMSGGY